MKKLVIAGSVITGITLLQDVSGLPVWKEVMTAILLLSASFLLIALVILALAGYGFCLYIYSKKRYPTL